MGKFYQQRHKMYGAHLHRELNDPERKAAEERFAQEHENWSNEELLNWVIDRKRKLGKKMKPDNTVGYVYLQRRLGAWSKFMGVANAILLEEKKNAKLESDTGDGAEDQEESDPDEDPYAVVEAACEYINAHLDTKLSVSKIAEQYGCSHAEFERKFLLRMGTKSFDYIHDQRMRNAAECLRSGQSLDETAKQNGYCTGDAFTKAFIKHYGITPRDFLCNCDGGGVPRYTAVPVMDAVGILLPPIGKAGAYTGGGAWYGSSFPRPLDPKCPDQTDHGEVGLWAYDREQETPVYFFGSVVESCRDVPKGMTVVELSGGDYMEFPVHSTENLALLQENINTTLYGIKHRWPFAMLRPDPKRPWFEYYHKDTVSVYVPVIPVKRKSRPLPHKNAYIGGTR